MSAIYILCKLNRPDGAPVDMGDGTVYAFKKNADGASIALVADRDHQKKLLSISEGYEFYAPAELGIVAPAVAQAKVAAPVVPPPAPVAEPAPQPDVEPGYLAPAASAVVETSDADADTFNPAATLDMDALVAWAELTPENTVSLRAMHATELGSEPRANAKNETIAAKLIAKRSA